MADLRWRLTYKGNDYEFDATQDLTVSVLRTIKQQYGPELGRWANFILAMGQGDPDAWSAAVWICLRKNGVAPLPALDSIDFAVGEMMSESEVITGKDEAEAGPTPPQPDPEPVPIPDSPAETLTNSSDAGSSPSPVIVG